MIRRYIIKKLSVTTLALLVILIYVIFPVKDNSEFQSTINYINNENIDYVYLKDDEDYVTQLKVFLDNDDKTSIIKEKIGILTIGSDYYNKVPNKFESLIPENTKINKLNIDGSILKIDFSKELLNVSKENEERMIEAIVFSLTENSNIKSIYITVEGNSLDKLPNSKKPIPSPLTRKYGINKKYDINSINNINSTTVFYLNTIDGIDYYTPISYVNNDNNEKIDIIINELKSTPIYQNSLKSFLNVNANLDSYEINDNIMYLVFNEGIKDDMEDDILESVKYTLSYSIKENYDVDDVVIKILSEN